MGLSVGTDVPSRSARARAASMSGAEMSTPVQRPLAPSDRATASVVAPAPQPTSSTRVADVAETDSTSRCSNDSNRSSSNGCRSTHAQPEPLFQLVA
jgi:hypothetical protein